MNIRQERGADEADRNDKPALPNVNIGGIRSQAIRAVEAFDGPTTDNARRRIAGIIGGSRNDPLGDGIAELVELTATDAYRSAFREKLLADDPVLTDSESRAMRRARQLQRALGLTDGDGGFMVPSPLDPSVMMDDDGSTNVIRGLARKVRATSSTWSGVTSDAAVASFDPEFEEVSDDSSTFGAVSIDVRAMRVFLPYSFELAEDAAGNFEGELVKLMRDARDQLEATVFLSGVAASTQPIGLLTALAGSGFEITSNAIDLIDESDVTDLYSAVGPRYRGRATWMVNPVVAQHLATFTNESTIALPPIPTSLVGRPVVLNDEMSAGHTVTGETVAVFGDFSHYVVADRFPGQSIGKVPHLFGATNNYPIGASGLFGWSRVGADVSVPRAFRTLKVG